MRSTVTPRQECPRCAYRFDGAAGAFTDRSPEPGDITLCMKCGLAMIFNEDFSVRRITREEIDALSLQERDQMVRLYQAICEMRAKEN